MAELEPGTSLDEFKIIQMLGSGGFGRVYLAQDTALGRLVAIKELYARAAAQESIFKRFIQEARIAGGLNHPNIVAVHALRTRDHNTYLILEYVSGGSLRDRLKQSGKVPVETAVRFASDVCRALAAVHAKDIIHRDIKPENILLTEDGHVKVSDFGIAHVPPDAGGYSLTATGFQPGTLAYMSPEQLRGEDLMPTSDVYQVAAMLYEMLMGKHYFDPDALMRQAIREVQAANPGAPSVQARWMALIAEKAGGAANFDSGTPKPLAALIQQTISAPAAERLGAQALLEKMQAIDLSAAGQTIGGFRVGAVPGAQPEAMSCPICRLTGETCDEPVVAGEIRELGAEGVLGLALKVETGQLRPQELKLQPPWDTLIAKLMGAFETLGKRGKSTPLRVAAYHLSREGDNLVAGGQSIVVLDPDWLINVTDLTEVDFCQRQLPLNRYNPSPTNKPMIRGILVHQLFPDIWRRSDSASIEQAKERVLQANAESLALAGTTAVEIAEEAEPHVAHLKQWADHQRRSGQTELRTETFMISPAFGVKGRIDAQWEKDSRPVILGELKTGKSQGRDPKPGHELQLRSYVLGMLTRTEIEPSGLRAVLLYSGNAATGESGENVLRTVKLDIASLQRSILVRNDLVLIDHTGEAAFELNPNKCARCTAEVPCAVLAILGGHQDPRSVTSRERLGEGAKRLTDEHAHYFRHYAALLTDELRAVKDEYAKLWSMSIEARVADGKAMVIQEVRSLDGDQGSRVYSLLARGGRNDTEFRVGDALLLSADAPGTGPTVIAGVEDVSALGIVVSTQDELRFKPSLVDLYTDERFTEALFSGLFRALAEPNPVIDAVVAERPPRFRSQAPALSAKKGFGEVESLNPDQRRALELSLRAEDYLLVVGPPGSGKTMLIEHMVREHLGQDRRVLVCAGTNRALDEAMERLAKWNPEEILRLGGGSASAVLRQFTLGRLMQQSGGDLERTVAEGTRLLKTRRIVGSTVHTLLNGKYEQALGKFDLVIVDEAAQLTVPATLGAIRLAERFVLIGDHRQLPAVVISKGYRSGIADEVETNENDLDVSLFEILSDRLEKAGGEGLVHLRQQYRMNSAICQIPSRLWYEGKLRPATQDIGTARLQLPLDAVVTEPALSPHKPIVVIDIEPNAEGGPRTSLSEARVVRRLLRGLHDAGLAVFDAKRPLAVIAPFRAQVARIRTELEAEFPDRREEIRRMVDTVDRFQGSECDVVIFSLATGDGKIHELARNPRRLNVAITRARHKLILLGSVAAMRADPLYQDLLERIEQGADYDDWCIPERDYLGAREA